MAIHTLTNISRSKGNQAMKFGQLIEYNMKNSFLEKSYVKYGGDTIPRLFFKLPSLSDASFERINILALSNMFASVPNLAKIKKDCLISWFYFKMFIPSSTHDFRVLNILIKT